MAHQLYVIVAEAGNDVAVPAAYILMQGRTTVSYVTMLEQVAKYIGQA